MQSHTPSFTFDPNFNFGTESVFGTLNSNYLPIIPIVTVSYLISETGDFLMDETGSNLLIAEFYFP